MTIRFTKMHGLGNDYVYVDCVAQRLDGVDIPALARAMSDRHRGIGADGLILITPPLSGVAADVRMEMYNADGSRGEMCGNGIRCVAKYAVEHGLVRPSETEPPQAIASELNQSMAMLGERLGLREITATDLRAETDRGVLALTAFASDGEVRSVRVDMGPPILRPSEIPVNLPGEQCVKAPMAVGDERLVMTCVSMGNPHAVLFVESVAAIELDKLGPRIERHPLFPNRVNVHVAEVLSQREVKMRTWERGTGLTQACGTGACAVLVAGVLEGRLERSALVHLPGGDLTIEWAETEVGPVFMTGSAEEVFSGEWSHV